MALIPKLRFPAQVEITDPGYPLGKARDVLVPGDGTGTPWTKDVVNDIWGFLQALLAKAQVEADNVVDKVGASQYLAAVSKAIAGDDVTWTGSHRFNAPLDVRGGALLSGSLRYNIPGIPRLVLPLSTMQSGAANDSMRFYPRGDIVEMHGDGSNQMRARLPIRIPSGCEFTEARVCVMPNASDTVVTIYRSDLDKSAPYTENVLTPLATATVPGGSPASLAVATISGPSEIVNNVNSEFFVEINAGSSSASSAKVYWSDLRVINKFLGNF